MGNNLESTTQNPFGDDGSSGLITPTVYTNAEILCYGDSLTAGYCIRQFVPYAETLSESFGGRPVDHAGMCGWTTERMVRRADSECDEAFGLVYPGLRRLVKSGRYSVVVLMAGTNDLGTAPASVIAENLARMHGMCHDAGAKTVAVTVPQSAFSSDDTPAGRLSLRSKQKEVNSLLAEFASANEHCLFVDMESRVPWSDGSADWMVDGLHMSRSGYQKFGRLLGPLILDFVSQRTDI